jgi:hypothetical protein
VRKALADDLVVVTFSEERIDPPEVLGGKQQVDIRVLSRRPDAQELLGPAAEDPRLDAVLAEQRDDTTDERQIVQNARTMSLTSRPNDSATRTP